MFTLKAYQYDHDYDDVRALIKKDIVMEDDLKTKGRFDVTLSSKDTWLHPGKYIFDIQLIRGNSNIQLALCKTNIVGQPTNRVVKHEAGDPIFYTTPITVDPEDPTNIVVDVPLVPNPPEHLVETLDADPEYILHYTEREDGLKRDAHLQVYGPRVVMLMNFSVPHDAAEHIVSFDKFFIHRLPTACPLRGKMLRIKNRAVTVETTRDMGMAVFHTFVQHSPEITQDAEYYQAQTNKPIYIGDNVDNGHINFAIEDGNDKISIVGNYYIPDDAGGRIVFALMVTWINWFDPDPPEEDPEPPVGQTFDPTPDSQMPVWPPEPLYPFEGE